MPIRITSSKKKPNPLERTMGKRETVKLETKPGVTKTTTVIKPIVKTTPVPTILETPKPKKEKKVYKTVMVPKMVKQKVEVKPTYTHRDYVHLVPQIKVNVVFFDGIVTVAHASFKGTHNTYLGVGTAKKNDVDTVSFNKGKSVAEGLAVQAVLYAIAKEKLPQDQVSRQAWMRVKNTEKLPRDFFVMPISR